MSRQWKKKRRGKRVRRRRDGERGGGGVHTNRRREREINAKTSLGVLGRGGGLDRFHIDMENASEARRVSSRSVQNYSWG